METGIFVREAMTNRPATAGSEITIKECAQLMRKHDVGSIIIVDGKKLLGIVTEYDLVRVVVAEAMNVNDSISKIMVHNPITISPDMDIYDATKIMNEKDIRHLPVVDGSNFVGFLTMRDILKIQPDFYEIFYESRILNAIQSKSSDLIFFDGYCSSCSNYSKKLKEYGDEILCSECAESRNF